MLAHKLDIPTDILWFSPVFLSKCCNTLKGYIHSYPSSQHYKSHAALKLALNNARINQPPNFLRKVKPLQFSF